MTSYNAIRDAIIGVLKSQYPDIKTTGEESQQSFTRPSFYVQLTPEAGQVLSSMLQQRQLLVDVHYFSAAAANARDRDMWGVADVLGALFGTSLVVGDRAIHIEETTPEIIDGVLQYQINLSYIDSRDDALEVALDDGTTESIMSEPEIGYIDGKVVPMRELTIKGE